MLPNPFFRRQNNKLFANSVKNPHLSFTLLNFEVMGWKVERSHELNEREMSSIKRESTKRGGEREGWGWGHVREIEHLEARTVTSMQLRKDSNM